MCDSEDSDGDNDREKFDDDEDDLMFLKSQLPLPEGVLKVNLGIPIMVVCHKVDLMTRGDKAGILEKNIDFIQKNIRSYCLTYGASLLFTDVHQQTNLELFYRYLLHRLYDYEFADAPCPNLKNSIFIPSGFDSLMLIDALCKGTQFENQVYESIVQKPKIQGQQSKVKAEIMTDDWQKVLYGRHGFKGSVQPNAPSTQQPPSANIVGAGIKQILKAGAQPQQPDGGTPAQPGAPTAEDKKTKLNGFYASLINKGGARGPAAPTAAGQKKPLLPFAKTEQQQQQQQQKGEDEGLQPAEEEQPRPSSESQQQSEEPQTSQT